MAESDINTSTSTPSAFTYFSRLPPELRTIIWRQSLPIIPNEDASLLHPYKKGCWHLDESELSTENEKRYKLAFSHERTGHAEVDISLLLVNREAHAIASEWIVEACAAGKSKINVRYRDDIERHIITRPFLPGRDVLYIPSDQLLDFLWEPTETFNAYPTWMNIQSISDRSPITTIAISESLFQRQSKEILTKINGFFTRANKVLLVTNAVTDGLEDALQAGEFRTLKEVPNSLGFYWDGETLDARSAGGNRIREDFLPDTAWDLSENLFEVFMAYDRSHFSIILAYAV